MSSRKSNPNEKLHEGLEQVNVEDQIGTNDELGEIALETAHKVWEVACPSIIKQCLFCEKLESKSCDKCQSQSQTDEIGYNGLSFIEFRLN